jgi:hypothetical protein
MILILIINKILLFFISKQIIEIIVHIGCTINSLVTNESFKTDHFSVYLKYSELITNLAEKSVSRY